MLGSVAVLGALALIQIVSSCWTGEDLYDICHFKPSVPTLEQAVCDKPHLKGTANSFHEPQRPEQDTKWEGPEHCLAGFCVYWTADRDSALVTNGHRAKTMMAEFSHAWQMASIPSADGEEALFRVAGVAGKGIGLIATRPIKRGVRVMVRQPSLLVQVAAQARTDVHLRDQIYTTVLEKLGVQARGQLLEMVGRDLGDKIDKNCFRLRASAEEAGDGGDDYIACYPDVARVNHDCRPSLSYIIDGATITVSSVRDIDVGEELSDSYIGLLSTRAQRLLELRHWGFNCSCAHCTMSGKEAAKSDARLRAITGLEADLDNYRQTVVMPETGLELIDLYRRERLDVYMGRAYTQAALNFAAFGMEEEARCYAKLAVEAIETKSGAGSHSEDWQSMQHLSRNPSSHWIWGYRKGKGQ